MMQFFSGELSWPGFIQSVVSYKRMAILRLSRFEVAWAN
ncbi:unnamed protein product [Acidithrix sp. C25]|nr:unnamed protein product [Acidithrix sp. C25]